MSKLVKFAAIAVFLSGFSIASNADPLTVVVGGNTYDVTFAGGGVSCFDSLTGCDNAVADFTFTNSVDADDALAQVITHLLADGNNLAFVGVDVIAGQLLGASGGALLHVPYAIGATVLTINAGFLGFFDGLPGNQSPGVLDANFSQVYDTIVLFAPSAVPLPGALLLFGSGLLGLLGLGKRRKVA